MKTLLRRATTIFYCLILTETILDLNPRSATILCDSNYMIRYYRRKLLIYGEEQKEFISSRPKRLDCYDQSFHRSKGVPQNHDLGGE